MHPGLDLNGKPVAVFGLGDSVSYGEYFCDAMEEVYRWVPDLMLSTLHHDGCVGLFLESVLALQREDRYELERQAKIQICCTAEFFPIAY